MLPIDHHTNSTIGVVFGGQVKAVAPDVAYESTVDYDLPMGIARGVSKEP